MDRKFLEEMGLSKENVDKVLDENSRDIGRQKAATDAKAAELDKANSTIKQLQDTVKKFDGVDVDALKRAAADWETKYNADLTQMRKESALKLALTGKAHDPADIIKLLDLSTVELDDAGNLKGNIDDMTKATREAKPYLFMEEKKPGAAPINGAKPAEPGAPKAPAAEAGTPVVI